MRKIFQVISFAALAVILLLALLFFADRLTLGATQTGLLVATGAWFIATPLWMGRKTTE